MDPRVVRPSRKIVFCWYVFAAIIIAVAVYGYQTYWYDEPPWLLAIPALVLFIPIRKHIRTMLTKLSIGRDRLTLETGLMSKYTRTVDLVKVQDVAVRQTLWQRMVGIGDLSLETAGETGMLSVAGINRPREVADLILAASSKSSPKGPPLAERDLRTDQDR